MRISSVRSPLPRRGAPGFSIESGVTKCPADLALRMIQLGATIVHVSEAVNEVDVEPIAIAMARSTTLVRFTAAGTVPLVGVALLAAAARTVPLVGVALLAAAALAVRGLTFLQLPGTRVCPRRARAGRG